MTQEELAEKVGLDRSYISQIETAKKDAPSLDVVASLARALETTPEDLFRAMVGTSERQADDDSTPG
jgi:transcriptional regulator with XRE-family HTH domain